VFVDESGFLMAPLLRRTWAPRGQTPLLFQRGRSHEKVSAIAALCVSPRRDRLNLYFRLHPETNINAAIVIDFLRILSRHLQGPVVLVWDRLNAHLARKTTVFLGAGSTFRTFLFPPYAPDLNPVEYVWGYLKQNPLANHPCEDVLTLAGAARHSSRSLQRKQHLLHSFIKQCPLPLRLK
jgi:transposase